MRPRRLLLIALGLVVIAWALVPAARGALLVRHGGSPFSANMSGYPAEQVSFAASDGVRLNGTLVPAPAATGTVILVHGFKSGRGEMLDWLAFLHPTYSVLLYDGRGVGSSDGVFGVGATEDRDILGAVDFIQRRRAAGWDRVAVLGISLGAGDAILAGARDERIRAVVADSPWIDEFVQLERMHSLPIGPVAVPLLPYEPALVDALLGGRLEDARLVTVVDKIAPRSLLLIHSLDDGNATTPVGASDRLFHLAGEPKELWLVPSG
ncbi:MAG TPA: alpha/beta fold hydrolase, partial [Candidatus Limnocylindria bacterium]